DTGLAAEWRDQVGHELARGLRRHIGADQPLEPVPA
ncbi:unnamed protein product, partial [marine sediment metagenome]